MNDDPENLKKKVLDATKTLLAQISIVTGIDITLSDLSIEKEELEIFDGVFHDKMVPIRIQDLKNVGDLCVIPIVKIGDRNINPTIILNIIEGNVKVIDSKVESFNLQPEEEGRLEKIKYPLLRILEAIVSGVIVAAIIFAIQLILLEVL